MATEEVVAAEAEAVAVPQEEEKPYELPEYDEALLIKVKGKVKPPVKPDQTESQLQIAKLKEEIDKRSERIKEIKGMEEARRANRSGGPSPAVAEINGRINTLRTEFQNMLRQKQHIREELSEAIKQRDALRTEQRALRDELSGSRSGVRTFDQVEPRLAELEMKLAHESMSATEEKRLHEQMQALNKLRNSAARHTQVSTTLDANDAQRSQISKRLTECDAVLKDLGAKLDGERAAKDEIMGKGQSEAFDWQAMSVEKQECWQIQQMLRAKIDEIRKEQNEKWQEFIKLDRNYKNWQRHDKHAKYLERKKVKEEREAEHQEQEKVATGGEPSGAEPFESEILTVDQLLTYLRKLVATEKAEVKVEKKEVEVPQGMRAFKRKDEEDLASAFVVKKKAPKGAQPKQEKAAAAPEVKKLNHALDTLSTFMTLKIEVPLTTAQIPATIEKVEAKRVEYLELRRLKKAGLPLPGQKTAHANGHSKAAKAADADAAGPSGSGGGAKPEEEEEEKAEACAASEEKAASPAKAASGDAEPVGVTLSVDKATDEVSIKLRVSQDE